MKHFREVTDIQFHIDSLKTKYCTPFIEAFSLQLSGCPVLNKDNACPYLKKGGGCTVKAKALAAGCPFFKKETGCPYFFKQDGCPLKSGVS